jgi:hypothetical protein
MSHGARSLYIALKRRYWQNRKNNGQIYLPQRKAVKELGSGMSQIVRWYRELQYYGFIVMMSPGCLGVDGQGRAPRWRLTEVAYMRGTSSKGIEDMPTMDFLKWDGAWFSKHEPAGDRAKPKTESRSRKREHTAPENGSTHAPENGSTKWNKRSRKREQVSGPSAPENGSKSINHVGGGAGSVKEESGDCEAAYLAGLADDGFPQPTLAEPAARTNGAQPQATKAKREADQRVNAPDPVPAEQIEIAPQAIEMEAALPAESEGAYDEVMRAIEAFCPDHGRRQEAVKDATRYLARWGGQAQGCGWTPVQQAALIWQMHGREVTALSSSQASIGNKVIYRSQL